jgi:hypothetical protein
MVKLPTEITMSKQTAVEWLVDELLSGKLLMPDLIEQAKEMEKEQIEDAFNEGVDWHRDYFGKQKGMVKIRPDTYGGNHE